MKQVIARKNGFKMAQTCCLSQQALPTTVDDLLRKFKMTLNDLQSLKQQVLVNFFRNFALRHAFQE